MSTFLLQPGESRLSVIGWISVRTAPWYLPKTSWIFLSFLFSLRWYSLKIIWNFVSTFQRCGSTACETLKHHHYHHNHKIIIRSWEIYFCLKKNYRCGSTACALNWKASCQQKLKACYSKGLRASSR